MTNSQKWILVTLLVFLSLFFLSKFTGQEEEYNEDLSAYINETTENKELNGLQLASNIGCTTCHGPNLEGGKIGPSLKNVSQYWRRDGLINYLRNPVEYSGDERFKEYKLKYPNIVMPAYKEIDVKDLGKIADYILSINE